jgi:predicted Zn-dependent peptidase
LVAIRLSVPFEEPPGLWGAGRVLQLLVENRLRSEVARFGGRIEFSRTPTALVYLVSGPAASFGEIVAVLRYAVAPPPGLFRTQNAIWLTARQESLVELETPDRWIRNRLQRALFPDLRVSLGEPGLTDLPDPAELESIWRRWFRPPRMSVVIAGAIEAEEARAAFRGWPEPPPAEARRPSTATSDTASVPEVVSARIGLGYPAGPINPAVLAIVAALIDEGLPALKLRQVASEHWWSSGEAALVLMGAAPVGSAMDAAALRTTIQISAAGIAANLTAADIARLRDRLRHTLLLRARSPDGMAAVIGEFLDRTGNPESAGQFFESLGEVSDESVRAALHALLYRPPIVVELDR